MTRMSFESQAAQEMGLSFRFSDLPGYRGNSHWTYLQLEAFHPSQEGRIGFLRVAYVSREVGEAINQDRLLYLKTRGHHIYPTPLGTTPEVVFSDPDTWDAWKAQPQYAARHVMESIMKMSYGQWNRELKEKTPEELVAYVEAHRPHLNQGTQGDIEKMFAFAVHKADVDYVLVDPLWRGNGIAEHMYEAMARYLDEHLGITLNCSTCQTQESKRCWEKMREKGRVATDPTGRMFFTDGIRPDTLAQRNVHPLPVPMPPAASGGAMPGRRIKAGP